MDFSQMKKASRPFDPKNKTWLENFSGTPLFEEAKALEQKSLQMQAEKQVRENQLDELKKQVGILSWQEEQKQEETIQLRKEMLNLQLAELRNAELMGASAEAAPPTSPGVVIPAAASPAPEAAVGEPKVANAGGIGAAIKGLNWKGLQASGGKILSSAAAPAAIGALAGGVGNMLTADSNESALGAFGKGALGGGLLAGGAHAAIHAGRKLGIPQAIRNARAGAPAAAATPAQLAAPAAPPGPAAPSAPAPIPDLGGPGPAAPAAPRRGAPIAEPVVGEVPDLQLGGRPAPRAPAGPQIRIRMDGQSTPVNLNQPQAGLRPQQVSPNEIRYPGGRETL